MDSSGQIHIGSGNQSKTPRLSRKQPELKKKTEWQVTDADEVVIAMRKTMTTSDRCEQIVSVLKGVRGGLIGTTKDLV